MSMLDDLDKRTRDDLVNRFSYHPATPQTAVLYAETRQRCLDLAAYAATVAPVSRELSLALTHLEEASFWINAAIARETPIATDPERART